MTPSDAAAADRSVPLFLGVSLKMYLDHRSTLRWVQQVAEIAAGEPAVGAGRVDLAVLPGFVSLDAVAGLTRGTPLAVGAQDLSWADSGAFTGEVSGRDLVAVGCRYVEVGHAERRRLFGEDDAVVAGKLAAAIRNGLVPILCVGEEERVGADEAARSCREQVVRALAELGPGADRRVPDLVIAYEPVWAIGAERPAAADHVRAVCRQLRDGFADDDRPQRLRVIYGGSAGPGLLTELGDAVDGLFLGRFAHDPQAFAAVIREAGELSDLPA
jgi:triosephosphate isomerase